MERQAKQISPGAVAMTPEAAEACPFVWTLSKEFRNDILKAVVPCTGRGIKNNPMNVLKKIQKNKKNKKQIILLGRFFLNVGLWTSKS